MFSVHIRRLRATCVRHLARLGLSSCARRYALAAVLAACGIPPNVIAQSSARGAEPGAAAPGKHSTASSGIDSLIARAFAHNPTIRAARARLAAAQSRVVPASLRPDPMLTLGILNFPVTEPGFTDDMTMKMIGVGQTLPYPGKLSLNRRIAEHGVEAAEADLAGATNAVVRDVRSAYYELAFLGRALEIAQRNRDVIVGLIDAAESRYGSGTGGQQDALQARVEAGRLAGTAVALTEHRRAALAKLNAVLDRPSDAPIDRPEISARVARMAVADSAADVRFVSAALGARASDSPLPSVEHLQAIALRESPALRTFGALIAAQEARAELASRAHLPDFDVSVQYGQRSGFPDMVSAMVSLPLPLRKGRKQNAQVAEALADLHAEEAERHVRQNEISADVARLHSELERDRAQLALYLTSIMPQGRASLASTSSSYQIGEAEFITLLGIQATLFDYEVEYFRLLSDFATTAAELELVVGMEILP